MVKSSLKKSRVSFTRKSKKYNKRKVQHKKTMRVKRRGATRRGATRITCRRAKRREGKQRGGALEPFTEADFGTYDYDEYMVAEPEQYNNEDEGYVPDENEPTLMYKGVEYPIYTDIEEEDYYIILNDDEGIPIMVKTSAVYREINKNV
jgi:hypothetical protein